MTQIKMSPFCPKCTEKMRASLRVVTYNDFKSSRELRDDYEIYQNCHLAMYLRSVYCIHMLPYFLSFPLLANFWSNFANGFVAKC